ncbi:MAG: carboxyl transferase domain-containing protein [Aquabacterium sp.]
MVTSLARLEGRTVGMIANDPRHLGGAIDAPGADKAARFMQLCDAYDIPMVSLCDTPGFMVGPDAEKTAIVRHFVAHPRWLRRASTIPYFTIVLRKGYGLGAHGDDARAVLLVSFFTVAWPTGEFGRMGLEGEVRLGFSKQLDVIEDPAMRQQMFRRPRGRCLSKGQGPETWPRTSSSTT